jgi:hypothetical protein
MEKHGKEPAVPQQQKGGETNIEAVETCNSIQDAVAFFEAAKQRLLDVNNWHRICGPLSANFQLTDANGTEVNRLVQVHDHFKIDIPGPGSKAGKGYDWVQVEEIKETGDAKSDNQSILIQVRPTDNPTSKDDSVAHFFSDDATSNFIVVRDGNKVQAAVRGRNEVPNTKADALVDKARNAVVGTGAIAGFSSPQWSRLAHAVLGK